MAHRQATRTPSVDYPARAELVETLVGLHATLTVVRSNWETGGGWQRLRPLRWAHALEPLARVHRDTASHQAGVAQLDLTNRDAWREVAMRADLAIVMDGAAA